MPRISTNLSFSDHLGACKARWGIGRMDYIVPPGLYAIGKPSPESQVVVTANYKMTYDIVRKALDGFDIWLLVLETYGINVWCAAGKGTFGTGEVVRRVESSGLAKVVSHRRLILPILGAPGVAAHQVSKRCGFKISYAAIRADDLPEYLTNGMATTAAMRKLTFSFYERLVLIPVEFVLELKPLGMISGLMLFICAAIGNLSIGLTVFGAYVGAVMSGLILGPLLLPILPSKSFAVKGAMVGFIWALCYYLLFGSNWHHLAIVGAFLALPAVSAFYTLNFTGCTTYTSRSGVKKEMRIGLPAMGASVTIAIVLLIASRYLY